MRALTLPILSMALLVSAAVEDDQSIPLKLHAAEQISGAGATKGPKQEPVVEVHGQDAITTTELMVADKPPIQTHQYVVRGMVKYDNVVGDGYLELWNDFGAQGSFFSRALGVSGGMRKISGTSGWRRFELPFFAKPGMTVQSLTLNLVLPGKGTVTVSDSLVLTPLAHSGEWWTNQQANVIGAILGSVLGLCGAIIGTCASLGRFPLLALSICRLSIVCGAVSVVAGIVALISGQPYHVYYVLLLLGLINLAALGANLPTISRRFRELEMRRMHATDVVGIV